MKKRGFTLIELMGVLIILGVLSLIIIPIVSNVLKEQKQKQYDQQIANIELMAKNFGSDNLVILPSEDGESMDITLGQLKSMGYVEKNIINPITEEEISNCARVTITKSGQNYNYAYDKDTENDTSCGDMTGGIIISAPVTKYIKKNEITSYIVTINDNDSENIINKYEIDRTKVSLVGETDAIYNIVEGNGIYRIVIRGGDQDGEVGLRLESKAILKNEIEDVIGIGGIEAEDTVVIDNTNPTITFGTNGSSTWSKEVSSTISVSDNLSGGVTSSYKYVYTKHTTDTPTNLFTSGTSYSQSGVTGNYYLIASACDRSGNCTTETSNAFKLDNTKPTISSATANSCSSNKRTITVKGSDSNSGISGYLITTSTSTPSASSFSSSTATSWTSSAYSSGTYYAWIKDAVGNISSSTTVSVGACDTTGPTITFGTDGSSSYVAQASTTVTATDSSGISSISYGWSTSNSSTSAGSSTTSGSTLSSKCSRTTDGDCYLYVKACDTHGNCSTKRTSAFKLDVTAPTITITNYYACATGLHEDYTMTDSGSGVAQYGKIHCDLNLGSDSCYGSISGTRIKSITPTSSKSISSEWTTCNTSGSDQPTGTTGCAFWVKAFDAVGNMSKKNTTKNLKAFSSTTACPSCP